MTVARPVAVVTGASRGVGKGIALALGDAGATVYLTGRTLVEQADGLPGSLEGTADEVSARGGHGIAVACDHRHDDQVAAVFDRVAAEHGHLDLLVNNAHALPSGLTSRKPFWDKPLGLLDMLEVGLRSSYVSTYFAAPLLTSGPDVGGLVVNTSSFGGRCYMHGPAYGLVKAGVDKMAHDMAVDFEPYGVAVLSLWLGLVRTERAQALFDSSPAAYAGLAATAESPEFAGRVIAALWALAPEERARWSGQVVIGAELGAELGVTDVDGSQPPSHRAMLGDPPTFNAAVVR